MKPKPYYTFGEHDDLVYATLPFYNRVLDTLWTLVVDGCPITPLDSRMLSLSWLALRIIDDVLVDLT